MDMLAQSRYLIIDDSNMIQSATRALLIKLGVPTNNIVSTANAQGAIRACRSHRFDILLIDHHLGAGSTGLQLLEYLRLKELIKLQTLVFVVTGNDSQDIFFGYSQFEPDGYLIKPIRADDIIKRVTNGLTRQQFFSTLEQAFTKSGLNAVKPLFAQSPDPATLKDSIIYMSNILIKNTQFTEATAMLNGLLTLHDYLPARIKLVEISHAQQHYQEALAQVDTLLDTNPRNIKLLQLKIQICLCAQKYEDAQALIQQVLTINTSNIALTLKMVWLHIINHDMHLAKPYMLSLASLIPHSIWDSAGKRTLTLWADFFGLPNDKLALWRAESAWQRLSRSEKPTSLPKSILKLCRCLQLLQLNEIEAARTLLGSIREDEYQPSDIEAYLLLCLCYQAVGDNERLTQLRQTLDTSLSQQDTGLSRLQQQALQKIDYQSLTEKIELANAEP
ncbi:response regulator [Photobacterium swingsii]|uniref:response regulator n=1 Tax=Photobacterium swingsii TaxID=680026 RepID=UPI00352C9975